MNFAVYELRPVEINLRKLNEGLKILTVASFFFLSFECVFGWRVLQVNFAFVLGWIFNFKNLD